MKITWNELLIDFSTMQNDFLQDWRWLIGSDSLPVIVSSIGDAFLQEKDGSIWWLDAGAGQYSQVADSGDDFKKKMISNSNDWFLPGLIGDLLTSGTKLSINQCFSYKKPPVLGGKYEPDNFEPCDISVHFSILGQIHLKIKDLPEGTPIGSVKIK
ncbi:MAG: T6SS immunity protein Tdi1 domain-containing protein [Candidatus Riflebacteria bacterium]